MRWSMVPVSVAVHSAVLVGLVLAPGGAGELPTPWPLAHVPSYVQATPLPAVPRVPLPTLKVPVDLPPVSQPTGFSDERATRPDVPGPVSDFGLPAVGEGLIGGGVGTAVAEVTPPPPPSPPSPPRLVRVGGVVREPRRLAGGAPVYPEIARAARVQGLVILEAVIDESGRVTDAHVLRSIPLLDAAALTAVRQWRYTPSLLNGVPVRVLMTITFNFQLADQTP